MQQTLDKLTYGLYVAGVSDAENDRFAGCVVDAVMQTSCCAPPTLAMSLMQKNRTAECICREKKFSLSVLPQSVDPSLIAAFGFCSSRAVDKWLNTPHFIADSLPVLEQNAAYLTATVTEIKDLGTHFLFLANVDTAQTGGDSPLSYAFYQKHLRARALKAFQNGMIHATSERKNDMNKEIEKKEEKWVCKICGYVYDGDTPFEDLPDDYTCPICGVPKSDFVKE